MLGPESFTLDGVAGGEREVRELRYADLARVRMAGTRDERLGGRQTLVIETGPARRFEVAAAVVVGPGLLREVADALTHSMTGV